MKIDAYTRVVISDRYCFHGCNECCVS